MLHSERPQTIMDGVVRGIPKRTMNPIVDGIITGVPRNPRPSIATPTEKPVGPCATGVPRNAFGSGIFQEGAGTKPKGYSHGVKSGEKEAPKGGTKKGEPRKTARKAYEK